MVLAKDVFVSAMVLMDEETEDGAYTGYPEEYKKKAWPILTILQTEILSPTEVPSIIADENSVLQLDDQSCLMTLPYGLAAHLLLTEDQNRAAFFNARYDEMKKKRPVLQTNIDEVYSVEPVYDAGPFD